jgi:hypothetical protein
MPYDPNLADRLRRLTADEPGVAEQRMFGGLAFLVGGHLAIGASSRGGLLVRTDPARTERLLGEAGAEPFEMRGRPMTGWLAVDAAAVTTDEALQRWVDEGVGFVRTLPPKPA